MAKQHSIIKMHDIKVMATVNHNPPGGAFVACESDESNILLYDVYYPDFSSYNTCALPFIIFVHGGGFVECAGIDSDGLDVIATEFAKRGFVCFLVNYRSGVALDPQSITYTSVQQMEAIYKAGQDIRGAIRSIIKRQQNETTGDNWRDTFRIDLDKMFLGGNSAGSVSILSAAYYPTNPAVNDQSKIDAVFPVTTGSVSFHDAFGSIDHNAYYGDSTIKYYSGIKGILNMWGSMFIPSANAGGPSGCFSGNSNNAPMISFHGFKDPVFPYQSQAIKFSPPGGSHAPYNSETSCLLTSPLILNQLGSSIDQYSLGSKGIFDNVLQPLSIFSEVYLDCSMGHGLDKNDDHNAATPYCSDFGIGTSKNSEDVLSYIVQRACTFFQAILGLKATILQGDASVHKVFIECINNRNKCSSANLTNNDCGNNNETPCTDASQTDNLNCVTP